jgi:hypothetical protein
VPGVAESLHREVSVNNDSVLRRSAPTVARGLDALTAVPRMLRRRPRWLIGFGIVVLLCGLLWANDYFSASSQARRRVRALGGYTGGPTAMQLRYRGRSPDFLTWLFRNIPTQTVVTGLVVEGRPVTDADIAEFVAAFPQLEQIDVSSTGVSDEAMRQIAGLRTLFLLRARNSAVTDAGVAELAGLSQLQIVELDGTPITDAGIAELAKLPRLSTLSVAGTEITDAGLAHLNGKALIRLVVSDTQVTDAGVAAFQATSPRCTVIR